MVVIKFDGGCVYLGAEKYIAGYGFCIEFNRKIYRGAKIIDNGEVMTNQVGEYSGLIAALRGYHKLVEKGIIPQAEPVCIFGDSTLVINMVTGKWGNKGKKAEHRKVPHLIPLLKEAKQLMPKGARLEWIPREQNKYCDELYNIALKKYRDEILKAPMVSLV